MKQGQTDCKDGARSNFRLLAGKALQEFIYAQVGYGPHNNPPEQWKHFHNRMSLVYDSVPAGYFGIFKEIADMSVGMVWHGLNIGKKII